MLFSINASQVIQYVGDDLQFSSQATFLSAFMSEMTTLVSSQSGVMSKTDSLKVCRINYLLL